MPFLKILYPSAPLEAVQLSGTELHATDPPKLKVKPPGGGEPTFTVTEASTDPPGPVQFILYVLGLVRPPVPSGPPLTGLPPDQSPEVVHVSAFVEDQYKDVPWP